MTHALIRNVRAEGDKSVFTVAYAHKYAAGEIDVVLDSDATDEAITSAIESAVSSRVAEACGGQRPRAIRHHPPRTRSLAMMQPQALATVEVPAVAASAVKSRAVQWLVEVVAASAGAAGILKAFDAFL